MVNNLDGATSYDFKLVANGGTYYASSDASAVVSKIIPERLETPTISGVAQPTVAVEPATNSATVSWTAVEHASGYTVYYKKTDDPDVEASWTVVSNIATPSYSVVNLEGATSPASDTSVTVSNLDGATSYDFKVVANGDGTSYVDSPASAVVSAIIKAKLAATTISGVDQPTIAVEPATNSATVSWAAVANASGYTVYYKKTNESNWTTVEGDIPASDTSVTVSNLDGATSYDFKVVANGDRWRDVLRLQSRRERRRNVPHRFRR